MLDVYAIPVSLYCAKLRILLRHKGLDWRELAPPGGYGSDEYKQIVPSGNLPALADGDLLIADSEAIAEYLNEKYPDPQMLPSDARTRAIVREHSRFHDTRLEPEVRALFPYISRGSEDGDHFKKQSIAINQRLAQFATMLESLSTDNVTYLTLRDCGFPITFAWIDALAPLAGLTIVWPSGIKSYRQKLLEYPAIAAELADYGPKLTDWLKLREG